MKNNKGIMRRSLLILGLLWPLSLSIYAQSVEYAKSLINQGKYLEATKRLRPLADGGNAEAQYLVATLFFDGKGVAKDEGNGIKYATLSANQRYEKGILLLVDYYEKVNAHKYIQTIEKYLKPIEFATDINDKLICRLGYALVRGYGINKDVDKGWEMIRTSAWHLVFIEERKIESDYYNYRAKKNGHNDMEEYCDYLYGINDDDCSSVLEYLLRKKGFDINKDEKKISEYYSQKANNGNGFAMALVAICLKDKNKEQAISWAKKAKESGSGLGIWLWNEQFSKDYVK